MASKIAVAALGLLMGAAVSVPAVADDTGLAGVLHTLKKEGRLLCQDGHFHYMTGDTLPDKKKAIASAIDNWQGFTAAEYGTDWAYFRKAGSKKITCNPSGTAWSCSVEGRPCK
jgi:hypothetical protein